MSLLEVLSKIRAKNEETEPSVLASYTTMVDKYTWQAVYNDGTDLWECSLCSPTCLPQHRQATSSNGERVVAGPIVDEHPIIAKYDQIDRDKLEKFNVYEREKLGTKDLKPIISVDIKPGYRLIWRKRRHQRVIGPQVPFKTVYLVGWQATIPLNKGGQGGCDGENVQSIIYLYENGKMEMSSQKSDYELFDFETETP